MVVRLEFRSVAHPANAWVPIRLLIGDVEILGLGENYRDLDPYLPLPVVKTAFEGLFALRQLRRHGRYLLELDRFGEAEDLLFVLIDGAVIVHSTMAERTASSSLDDLEEAWQAFADSVRSAVAYDPRAAANIVTWERWPREDPPWLNNPRSYESRWRERFDRYRWQPEQPEEKGS